MEIIQYDNTDTSILRQVSLPVPLPEINSHKIQDFLRDLKTALDSQGDGVGISAVQVGNPIQVFILSHKAYDVEGKPLASPYKVFINPRITKVSKDMQEFEEGCLSIRGVYGKVTRPFSVTVQAYNEHGDMVIEQANGFVAHVIQHEMDHLDGILFIDRAQNVRHDDTYAIPAE